MLSLEPECAACAQDITRHACNKKEYARDLENRLRNALQILQEQGLYAFFLFLRYKRKAKNEFEELDLEKVWNHLAKLFTDIKLATFEGKFNADENQVISITHSLIKLRVIRFLISQTLVYTLYGLRAIK
jgi:hypothetical protein